tara:strand:+ start:6235 stop:7551 length:1317 start_codon:yes stop_codon:yes gene_type:complete
MATEKQLYNGGASSVLYTDRRDFYVDPQVTKELWTDVAPFTTLVSNRETRDVPDPIFKMFEHRNPWVKQEFSINKGTPGTLPNNDTGLPGIPIDGIVGLASSADSSYVGLEVEIWNSAKSTYKTVALVSAVASNGEITLKHLKSGTQALADNDVCIVIGNARGEGSSSPDAWSDELSTVWNSTQIFKTPLQITGTLEASVLRGESSELARLRKMKAEEHKMQKEKAFLFGKRIGGTGLSGTADSFADNGRTDADGNIVRTTYGLIPAIEDYGASSGDDQNIFTVASSYAYGDFVDDMEKVFQYVPEAGVKRAFCGAGALGYWSKLASASGSNVMASNSGWTVNIGDMKRDALGFNYRVLETPHGMLQLIPTPALRGPYNKYMVVVSDENLFHAQYRPMVYQANIKQDNAFDGVKDQYMSDEGLGLQLIESHKLFKITA